jgi:hypothetical protein
MSEQKNWYLDTISPPYTDDDYQDMWLATLSWSLDDAFHRHAIEVRFLHQDTLKDYCKTLLVALGCPPDAFQKQWKLKMIPWRSYTLDH